MKLSQMFPSKWLSSADIEGHTPNVKIRAITIERVGAPPKDEDKYVMWFEGKQKGLILNKTNGMAVGAMYGDETDNWMGKPVQLYVAKVRAFGAVHDAIRVRGSGTVSAAPLPVHDADDDLINDLDEVSELDGSRVGDAHVPPGIDSQPIPPATNGDGATDGNPFDDEPPAPATGGDAKAGIIGTWRGVSDAKVWAGEMGTTGQACNEMWVALVKERGGFGPRNASDVYAAWYDMVAAIAADGDDYDFAGADQDNAYRYS